jgi:kinesin family protein C1
MANREVEDEDPQPSQQKGMKIPDFFPRQRQRHSRTQNPAPQQPASSYAPEASREVSGLRRCLATLSLHDQPHDNSSGDQVAPQPDKQPLCRPSQSDGQTESIAPSKVRQEEAARLDPLGPAKSQGTIAPQPTTPPQIKICSGALEAMGSLLKSHCKRPFSPTKSSSPTKLLFLSKDSNLTSYTGWDVDGRLNEFESQFKVMKEAFEGTVTDRKAMEEAIDLAKNRGMYLAGMASLLKC